MAYQPPTAVFSGHKPDMAEVIGHQLERGIFESRTRETQRVQRDLDDANYRLRRTMEELQAYRNHLTQVQAEKARIEARLKELQNTETTDEGFGRRIEELCDFIKQLPGVIGSETQTDGSVLVLLRTAIRANDGILYDMGDFTISIGGHTFNNLILWEALPLKNIRLSRRRPPRHYGEDLRLHLHGARFRTNANGINYAEGGWFCFGNRKRHIIHALQNGDIKQALTLVVSCLNSTQEMEFLPRQGVQIPKCNEEAFFMGATPTA